MNELNSFSDWPGASEPVIRLIDWLNPCVLCSINLVVLAFAVANPIFLIVALKVTLYELFEMTKIVRVRLSEIKSGRETLGWFCKLNVAIRSEERRVGKECRSRW